MQIKIFTVCLEAMNFAFSSLLLSSLWIISLYRTKQAIRALKQDSVIIIRHEKQGSKETQVYLLFSKLIVFKRL